MSTAVKPKPLPMPPQKRYWLAVTIIAPASPAYAPDSVIDPHCS